MLFSYSFSLKRLLYISIALLCLYFLSPRQSFAFLNISDTVTTSRPSAASPLSANGTGSTNTELSIYNNGSRFLASDSARIVKQATGASVGNTVRVSSQSASLQTVFFGNQVGATALKDADVLLMPVTAMHTVAFKTSYALNATDTLTITFPFLTTGDSNVPASPSASTFQINGIATAQVKVEDDGANFTTFSATSTNPTAGTSPRITITISSGSIAAGSTVKLYLGCDTWAGAACTVQTPRIINPTKTAVAGTSDAWKIAIAQGGGATDTATVALATVESVTLRATVDPTLTFIISGINNGQQVSNGNAGCSMTSSVNTGINSSATDVNFGVVQQTPNTTGGAVPNVSAQLLTVTTNGPNGYSLTATASSSLLMPETGFIFNASLTPASFPGTGGIGGGKYHFFGLHPCGQEVNTSWVNGGGAGSSDCTMQTGAAGSNCLFAWPSVDANPTSPTAATFTLASNSVGPIGTGNGNTGLVSVAYGAGMDVTVPPGQYRTVITYTATPTF